MLFSHSNKSDSLTSSQTSFAMRRVGVLESSLCKQERGRKDGLQEGLAMPVSQKKRKDAVQEGSTQLDLIDNTNAELDQQDAIEG